MSAPRPGTPEFQGYIADQGRAAASAALRMWIVRTFSAAMACVYLFDELDEYLHGNPISTTGMIMGAVFGYVAIRGGKSAVVSRILSGQPARRKPQPSNKSGPE